MEKRLLEEGENSLQELLLLQMVSNRKLAYGSTLRLTIHSIEGPLEMREVIRHHAKLGVDQIKLSMSGEEVTHLPTHHTM